MWSNGDGCICGVLTPEVDPCIWCIRNYCLKVSHKVNKCSVALVLYYIYECRCVFSMEKCSG